MIYQEEKISEAFDEMDPLMIIHWQEVANNQDIRPLDINYDKYIELNNQGHLRLFTVRDDYGTLVGYATYFIADNLHYKTWKYASNDVYYLSEEHRKTGVSTKMFEEIEKWLKDMDVNNIVIQDKVHHTHEKFFTKMGYTLIEQNYEKVI